MNAPQSIDPEVLAHIDQIRAWLRTTVIQIRKHWLDCDHPGVCVGPIYDQILVTSPPAVRRALFVALADLAQRPDHTDTSTLEDPL